MQKKVAQEALELTRECLMQYWQLNPELVLSYCDEDVLWTGTLQKQFIVGREATAEDLRGTMRDLKPCHLMEQDFFVVQNSGNVCTVAGRYLVTTDERVEFFLQVQQRCTFVWEQRDGKLKICHMHISNPLGELKTVGDEMFPSTMGRMAHKYLMRRFSTLTDKTKLMAADLEDREHIFLLSEILYVEAGGRISIIAFLSGAKIPVRMTLTEFQEKADERFAAVHRSYVINTECISRIKKYEVVLSDGTRIPIPVKKYRETREMLLERLQ